MSHSPEELYPQILDSISEGVLTVDPEFRITSFNAEAKAITGFSREQALAHKCYEALRSELSGCRGSGDMIGASPAMEEIFRLIPAVNIAKGIGTKRKECSKVLNRMEMEGLVQPAGVMAGIAGYKLKE